MRDAQQTPSMTCWLVTDRMRIRISHETVYRYEQPATRRDPDAAADAAQPRRPVRRRLAHRRLGRTAGSTQHEDAFGNITHVFTADGPLSTASRAGRGRGRDPGHQRRGARRRSSAFRRACYLRETRADRARPGDRRPSPRARRRAGDEPLAMLHDLLDRLHERHGLRQRRRPRPPPRRPKPSRCKRGVCQDLTHIFIAAAREPRASRRATSPATSTATTASPTGAPATPGPRPSCPTSAGSASTPPTGSAPTDAMCASRSGSTTWAPPPVRGSRYGGGSRDARPSTAGASISRTRQTQELKRRDANEPLASAKLPDAS